MAGDLIGKRERSGQQAEGDETIGDRAEGDVVGRVLQQLILGLNREILGQETGFTCRSYHLHPVNKTKPIQ